MKVLKKWSVVLTLLTAVMLVVSCGGGGGGSATSTAPGGSGSITLDPVTKVISGSFTTTNVVNATLAHIHDGNIGVAGPVVVALQQSTPGTWTVPANSVLTDAQIARLQAGGYYVNVHTALNPAGEIRGQLNPDSTTANKFVATLNLAQEVPTPTTPVATSSGAGVMGGY
jgi:CHRD domain-containing protein